MSNNTAELNCKKISVLHKSNQSIISVNLLLTEGNFSFFFHKMPKCQLKRFALETELIPFFFLRNKYEEKNGKYDDQLEFL